MFIEHRAQRIPIEHHAQCILIEHRAQWALSLLLLMKKMIGHNHFDDQIMSKLLMKSTSRPNGPVTDEMGQ